MQQPTDSAESADVDSGGDIAADTERQSVKTVMAAEAIAGEIAGKAIASEAKVSKAKVSKAKVSKVATTKATAGKASATLKSRRQAASASKISKAAKAAAKAAAKEGVPLHKNAEFALQVALWVQAEDRAVTAWDIADQFQLEVWQARKLLHYMMALPGIIACLDWGYPQDTAEREHVRPTRLFSIVRVIQQAE